MRTNNRAGSCPVHRWRSRTSSAPPVPAWRDANRGHVSLDQMKVMSAIERCRTAALGGHVARCENGSCRHTHIAYNSCRNRHCSKCQGGNPRQLPMMPGQCHVPHAATPCASSRPSRPARHHTACRNRKASTVHDLNALRQHPWHQAAAALQRSTASRSPSHGLDDRKKCSYR